DGVLLATPGDPSGFLYACGITSQPSGVFRSLDGGETWAATSVTVQADTIIAGPLAGTVFAGTVEGIFVSGDSGSTWTRMTPPLDVAIDSFAFGGSALYAATEAGLYVLSTIPVRDFPKTPPAPILHPTRIGAFRSVK
ncbi:MAG: WD40/YVTN/BNR-like repeat-containing protein, partial [Thermoanaerobaculia bacterium]